MKKKRSVKWPLILLSAVLLLAVVIGLYFVLKEEPPCTHTYGEWVVDTPATCETQGQQSRTCTVCMDKITVSISRLNHETEIRGAKTPTCTEIGWDDYVVCIREGCTFSTYVEKSALGHNFAEEWSFDGENHYHRCIRSDKCEEKADLAPHIYDSETDADCNTCGATREVVCEHDGIIEVTAGYPATCESAGRTDGIVCVACGTTLNAQEEIPALGHAPVTHPAKAPTCTEKGWEEYATCSREGCDYTTYAEKPALDHATVSHAAQAPTCTEQGWKDYVRCTRCDYTTYESVAALGHDYATVWSYDGANHYHVCNRVSCRDTADVAPHVYSGELDETCNVCGAVRVTHCSHSTSERVAGYAATCNAIGKTDGAKCSACGQTLIAQQDIPALGHNEQNHAAQAPTCEGIGWDAYVTCSRCTYTTYAEKPALGHDEQNHAAQAQTCTGIGWDAYVTCSRCSYTTYVEKPALGHNEQNHAAQAPTCEGIGWDAYVTCSRCTYTTYAEKPALGHNEQSHAAKEPTCTEIGWYAYVTCGRAECGHTTYVERAALGHETATAWTKGENTHYHVCTRTNCGYKTDEAAHTYDGELDADCNICGAVRVVICSHPATELLVGYAATCTAEGKTDGLKCTACGETLTAQQTIPAQGHDEENHAAQAETCEGIGWDAYVTCSRCTYTTYVEKPALGHDEQNHAAQAPTCEGIGWDAYVTCSRCTYTTYAEKPALGHDEVPHAAQAQTCEGIGWDAYVTCSRCTYTTYVEKPALGHDEVPHAAQAQTCEGIGWDAYVTCSRCSYTTYAEKPALGHDEQSHAAQAQTCEGIGWDAYVTCSRCTYTTYAEKPALGHAPATTWTQTETIHYRACTRTNCTYKADEAAHTPDTTGLCTACGHQGTPTETDPSLFAWEWANGGYAVKLYTGSEAVVVIPATYLGKPVVAIQYNAFAYRSDLTSVVIPASVTSIGESAFERCWNLKSVLLPDALQSIGQSAFNGCWKLTDIRLPNGLKSIGQSAFEGCEGLSNILLPEGLQSIGYSAFEGCSGLTDVFIPASVQSIASGAFYSCTKMTAITVAQGNEFYSSDANGILYNKNKTQLIQYPCGITKEEFAVPDGVTDISIGAFYCCVNLVRITIPSSVTSIGYYTFGGCQTLESIAFAEDSRLTEIGTYAFSGCTSLRSVTFGKNAPSASIGSYAFQNCTALETVTFADNNQLVSIGEGAFKGCTSLESVSFGANSQLQTIGKDVFYGCTKLASITIPATVTNVKDRAFWGCTSLESVSFESNSRLQTIGQAAFDSCTNLKTAAIGECNLLTSIGQSAFSGCRKLVSIFIPAKVGDIGAYAFSGCANLTGITVAEANEFYSSDEYGVLYNKDKTTLIRYPAGNTRETFAIPNSVTSIAYQGFNCAVNLKTVLFPTSVQSVDGYAFYGCTALTTVYYEGATSDDWYSISFASNNDSVRYYATVYYYSAEQPTAEGNYWRYVDGVPKPW